MTLVWPAFLWCLALVPALLAVYVWMQLRRRRYTLRYSSVSLISKAVGPGQNLRRHAPATLYLLAMTAMILGLARPQMHLPIPQATGTVILAIDASRSMLTTDIAPSRIDAAKAAVRDFVAKQPEGIKVGLVAFSSSAFVVTPPTDDRKQVIAGVNSLSLGTGTNIGNGLQVALDAVYGTPTEIGPAPDARARLERPPPANAEAAVIVLLSDGASTTGPSPLDVAKELARAGVKTYTVGVGTRQSGTSTFGGRARELDEATLRGIANETGGQYFSAENAKQLHEVYGKIARHHDLVEKRTEVTFVAAGAGMLLMLAASGLGVLWSNRLP